jgi:addiction module RelB/DinJ family antitoxin
MNEAIVNIKTDIKVKRKAEKLASEIGLSLNNILNIYLRQFVLTKHLDVDLNVIPEAKELLYIKEGKAALRKGKRYKSAESMINECLK